MGLLLCSNQEKLADLIDRYRADSFAALLFVDHSELFSMLEPLVEDLLVVDVNGPRLSRLNFDAVEVVVVDFSPAELLSSAGRRLVDVLGRLAEESLTLVLYGAATATAGAFLLDGKTAGLNLVPHVVVVPDLQVVPELRTLLDSMSGLGLRLLALDGVVAAHYDYSDDTVEALGEGNVLTVGFADGSDGTKTARIQPLRDGMRRGWPA